MSFLPRIPPPSSSTGPMYGTDLDRAIAAFAAAAMRASSVDAIAGELLRLRCARYHDCRRCGALRNAVALEDGIDESFFAKIDDYERSDLDDRFKVVLRLTDAMITHPGSLDDRLRRDLHKHFSDQQIVEMTLDIMKYSYQKVMVALRLEAPPGDGLRALTFDAEGKAKIGDPIVAVG